MIWLLLLVLSSGPALPKRVLLVDTSVEDAPPRHLRIYLYPVGTRLVSPGDDVPSLVGRVEFEVWRGSGEHMRTYLDRIGGPERFTLSQTPFSLVFQDLNHDGRPEFSLCERTGAYVSDCIVLRIEEAGPVGLLPVDYHGPGFTLPSRFKIEGLESSSHSLEVTSDGFCYPTHWPKEGKQCLRWNSALARFETVQ